MNTIRHLAYRIHDLELEPFIDTIPDVLWSTSERRRQYDGQIHRLINDSGSRLLMRIQSFGQGCFSDIIPIEVAKRRKISYYKLIWALGSLSTPEKPIQMQLPSVIDPEVFSYYISADGVRAWATLCASKDLRDSALKHLRVMSESVAANDHWTFGPLHELAKTYNFGVDWRTFQSSDIPAEVLSSAVNNSIDIITYRPLQIPLNYLEDIHTLEKIPYRFWATQALLSPPPGHISGHTLAAVQALLDKVVYDNLERFSNTAADLWADEPFHTVVSYWNPQASDGTLPWAVVDYLTIRKYEGAIQKAIHSITFNAWTRLPETILNGCADTPWQFTNLYPTGREDSLTTPVMVAWLLSVLQTEHQYFTPSVIAVAKRAVVKSLEHELESLTGEDL
ncbi:hypothetical protein B0H16DRAFT_1734767 [Mycena metata]|uniref:Uncharacterized protein n=1 Tax=Mycena metata TaxID=1033252 RepID=A0AAD7HTT7_9AGAR|nr:hypothetical protein B0H16DRAFT_1734767 [Mycena metata]